MIRVENLSVNYGHITALEDVSFRIERGEIVTLIGSNGAGKTTSLMAISGLVLKKAGRVFFEDTDITDMAPDKIVRLGVCHVPEGRKVFPALTVYENLIAGTVGNPGMKKKQIAEQLEKVYDLFPRLKERRSQDGGTLSGGEQQMLAIARGPDDGSKHHHAGRALVGPGADRGGGYLPPHPAHQQERQDHTAHRAKRLHGALHRRIAAMCWKTAASCSRAQARTSSPTRTCRKPIWAYRSDGYEKRKCLFGGKRQV